LSWLNTKFQKLPAHGDHDSITQYACVHILILIYSMLMPDTSASLIHFMYLPLLRDMSIVSNFSWGSIVLACLYRALDHDTKF